MKTSSSFSVSFYARTQKANNRIVPIYAIITVNSRRVNISTKKKIALDNWSEKGGKAKSTSKEAQQLNLYLDKFKAKIMNAYQDLFFQGKPISAQIIKDKFTGEDEEEEYTLLKLFDYHNERSKDILEWGTLKNYFTTKKYIVKFLRHRFKRQDIPLGELRFKFLTDFEYFMRKYKPVDHHKPMGNNTVMKHIERLRKVINMGIDLEWLTKDPFSRFKKHFEKTDRGYLSAEELQSIENKKFAIERLALVKALFIISCYTGLAYKDVMLLTPDHIVTGIDSNKWISTKRLKTSVAVNIPLLPKAMEVIDKYRDHPRAQHVGTLHPNITNQKLNAYLKEIADLCGIKKNLTFHLARHTFATTVTLTNGVPIETVSKLLGHTSIRTTQIYARIVETKLSNDMDILRMKLEGNTKNVQIRKYKKGN